MFVAVRGKNGKKICNLTFKSRSKKFSIHVKLFEKSKSNLHERQQSRQIFRLKSGDIEMKNISLKLKIFIYVSE
jgi:hypothetical protein